MDTYGNATVDFKLLKDMPITRIEILPNYPSGDYWINLGDITVRDKSHQEINIQGRPRFGNGGNWGGLPPSNLTDNDRASIGHSSREVETLIIDLPGPTEVGFIQITNRQDCCWHRIAGYRLALYNNNELLGARNFDNPTDPNNATNTLVGQGKSIQYKII